MAELMSRSQDDESRANLTNLKAMNDREKHQATMMEKQANMGMIAQKAQLAAQTAQQRSVRHGAARAGAAGGAAVQEPGRGLPASLEEATMAIYLSNEAMVAGVVIGATPATTVTVANPTPPTNITYAGFTPPSTVAIAAPADHASWGDPHLFAANSGGRPHEAAPYDGYDSVIDATYNNRLAVQYRSQHRASVIPGLCRRHGGGRGRGCDWWRWRQ